MVSGEAAKLARLVYRMLRYGMKYVDQGAAFYELRHRELQIKRLSSPKPKSSDTESPQYRSRPNKQQFLARAEPLSA